MSTTLPSALDLLTAWYRKKPGEAVHGLLVPYGKSVQGSYRSSHQIDRVHQQIYLGTNLRRYSGALTSLNQGFGGNALARLNASKAVVDTVVARLSKRRAMPSFKVDNADWSLKRKAKNFRKFIVGKMTETDFEEISPLCLRDGSVTGNGFTYIDDDEDDVCAERVYRREILVDPRETTYGKPWQMMRTMRVARDVLADMFPDHKAQIMSAPASVRRPGETLEDMAVAQLGSLDQYVDVWKAWRRSSGGDAKDGRYACVIDGATLMFEQYDCERFPFAHFRYTHPLEGFWGTGLIEDIADLQHRVNRIVRAVQLNIDATSMGSYQVNENYRVPVEMMTGARPFEFVFKGPNAPEWKAPAPIADQTISLLQFFVQQMFDLTGVPQAAAQSKPSLGLNASGVALDTQYDIESERFAMVERQYAKFRLDAAQCYLDAAGRVAKRRYDDKGKKRKSSYISNWRNRDSIERLDYKEVEMQADQYRLELEPVNFIPDTRAGKFATVQELTAAGVIPQWLAAALYDEPDLQRAQLINCAAYFNQERIMEQLGDETKDMVVPEPEHDLDMAEKMSRAFYNYSQAEGAPEEVQSRYLQYHDLVVELIAQKNAASAPPAPGPMDAGMGAPPMGGPTMPPGPPGLPPGPPAPPMPPDMGMPMPAAA